MKKLFTILYAVMITFTLSAQQFGAKTGITLATLNGAATDGFDLTIINPGLMIGVFTQFDGKIGTTAELLLIQKGYKKPSNHANPHYVANYLEANVMGKYFVVDNISINSGIYVGYLSSAKMITKYDGDKESENIDFYNDERRRIDLGTNFGVTYYLNEAMNINLRYGLGLINQKINPSNLKNYGKDLDSFNSTIQIAFGYSFGSKKQ